MKGEKSNPIVGKPFKLNLFKEMIDKQQIEIFETREGRYFARAYYYISGSYSSSHEQNYNSKTARYHPIKSPIYTNPTILMYTIIMKKSIFFRSLLNFQLEIFSHDLEKVLFQGMINKTNILDVAIENYSDECFDIILELIENNNVKFSLSRSLFLAITYKNKHAINPLSEKFVQSVENMKEMLSIKDDFKNPIEFDDFLNINFKGQIMKDYLQKYKALNRELNDSDGNSIDIKHDSSNDIKQDEYSRSSPKCSINNCSNSNINRCPICNKYFCDEHMQNHVCNKE